MTAADSRSIVLALHAWLDGDEGDRNANRLAEYVIQKAIGGRFEFFKLVLDMVDGPIDRESEEGLILLDDRTSIIIDDRRGSEIANAA